MFHRRSLVRCRMVGAGMGGIGVTRIVHFVGFRDDRYWNAVKAFGPPHYIHPRWDLCARRELDEGDLVIFADGPHDQEPRARSYNDLNEAT